MPVILALTDLIILVGTWSAAVNLRYFLGGSFLPASYLGLLPAVLIQIVLNAFLGSYNILLSPPIELKKCTMGTLLFVLLFTATTFWTRTPYAYSRGILLIGGVILLIAIPAGRVAIRAWCGRYSWWGYRTVFYCHEDYDARHLRQMFKNLSSCLRPSAVIFQNTPPPRDLYPKIPVFFGFNCLGTILQRHPNAVFVFLAHAEFGPDVSEILAKAERIFGRIIILHECLNLGNLWTKTVDLGNMLGLEATQRLLDSKRQSLKTITDLAVSTLLLTLLLPLFAIIMLCVWLENPGPFFYRHKRLGKNGKIFFALKFRTMYPNSEDTLKQALDKDANLQKLWREHRKLPKDPRITKVGHFLRHSSLDELPQLINVLRGEMSLIGPRPIMAEEILEYGDRFAFVNQVRPGLTGLWQVSGRSRLTYAERVEYDVYYIKNWSFWLDMYILLKTPAAVLDFSSTA
jgi:exopolysaccharide biosynthesis polyprenyl glycosylphosphotransferase